MDKIKAVLLDRKLRYAALLVVIAVVGLKTLLVLSEEKRLVADFGEVYREYTSLSWTNVNGSNARQDTVT